MRARYRIGATEEAKRDEVERIEVTCPECGEAASLIWSGGDKGTWSASWHCLCGWITVDPLPYARLPKISQSTIFDNRVDEDDAELLHRINIDSTHEKEITRDYKTIIENKTTPEVGHKTIMANSTDNQVTEAIKSYLDARAASDPLFAVTYAKENKNLDECLRYIIGEARKRGNSVYMSDDEVFGMAVHYYDEDDIKINRSYSNCSVSARPAEKVELTAEEKEKARQEAIKIYQRECVEEMHAADKAARAKKRTSSEPTTSLFTPDAL